MSTRKDGKKASDGVQKKKNVSKTTTKKREESTDRSNKKTEEPIKKIKPLATNSKNELVNNTRSNPQIVKKPSNVKTSNSTPKVTRKTTVPMTPPSKRISKTQFFPSKNLYSNALKSDQTTNKVVASSSREMKRKQTEPETKKNKVVEERAPRKSIINIDRKKDKVVVNRETYRASKQREASPDTSSTSERPRTATLRKGSIVNDNIVGPDAPKPAKPKIIKEIAQPPKPKSPEVEEIYEDDFESYESDFEECSSSVDLNDISGEETSSSSSDAPKELTVAKKRIPSAGAEEDRKLDSGNYDMPDFKHKQILDNIKELVERENATLDLQRNNPASLSDEGFEDQKSLQFINFLDAKKKCEHRKSIEIKKRRGEDILNMIRLDTYSFTLFDLPSVPYETFIKSYGRNNTLQTAVQTGEDDVDETVQTEEIVSENKWTQLPVYFPKIDVNDPNYLQICKSSFLGVGKDNYDEEKSVKNWVNHLKLRKFMSSAGDLIMKIQEESSLERYEKLRENPREIPFSDGYISFDTSQDYLKGSSIQCVSFCGDDNHRIMTVHVREGIKSGSVICVWNISNCEKPEVYFTAYGKISCCSFGVCPSDFVYGGQNDGTISVWNTKRSIFNEDSHLKRIPLHTTDIGNGHKTDIVSLQPFFNNAEKSTFQINQTNEICSVDETGYIILWSLIIKNQTKDNFTSSTDWSDVVLVKNTVVYLQTIYPELEELHCTDCILNSMDSNFILVSTNYGFIIHYLVKGGRSNVKKFVPASQSTANCLELCPFSPNYFLAGFDDGNINLYSRLVEKPLMVLSDKEGDFGKNDIKIIQWSKSKPFVVYSKDAGNTIHIWDLDQSDIFPIYSIPFEKNITCMKLSPYLADDSSGKSYMIIGTEDGQLLLHLLNSEYGQQPQSLYKDHVNTFLKYVNRL